MSQGFRKLSLQVFNRLFFNTAYIGAGDSELFGKLPLCHGIASEQSVPEAEDHFFAFRQHFVKTFVKLSDILF